MIQQLITQTESVIDGWSRKPSYAQIIAQGLADAQAKGDAKAVDFWQRSQAKLEDADK